MTTTYTLEEVSKHKKHGDTWCVIKNKVYDVSKFMDQHPGGEEVLLDSAGLKIWNLLRIKFRKGRNSRL
jgi:cytochrome b involved in lipid metabolism